MNRLKKLIKNIERDLVDFDTSSLIEVSDKLDSVALNIKIKNWDKGERISVKFDIIERFYDYQRNIINGLKSGKIDPDGEALNVNDGREVVSQKVGIWKTGIFCRACDGEVSDDQLYQHRNKNCPHCGEIIKHVLNHYSRAYRGQVTIYKVANPKYIEVSSGGLLSIFKRSAPEYVKISESKRIYKSDGNDYERTRKGKYHGCGVIE